MRLILTEAQFNNIFENIKNKLEQEREKVNTSPSEAQCKAGNYAMGHIWISGFEITIENPKGSYRRGKDRNGKEWKVLMHNDYGYFTKTKGKDGDAIDVFLGPYLDDKIEDAKIYPIDQFVNGEFDETKIMMGFRDKESAKKAYLSNYEKDWKGFKYISEVDVPTFKKWLYDGYRQRKPFAKYVSLTESIKSMVKNNVEDILRKKVREMVKDGSLSTEYSLEMAEHYNNIISKAFNINKDDVMDKIGDDDKFYHSIIDDEFEKCGGEYDTMDVEAHKKSIQKSLEKLHQEKIIEYIKKKISLLNESVNVNMNVSLRKGGRNAVKMTEKEFEEELKALYEKYMLEEKPTCRSYDYKWSLGHFVYKCCYNNRTFEKSKILSGLHNDIWNTKYKFDTENVESRGKIKMSSKGVPYLIGYAGGDWECPVCFILYFDGNKVRAYIPLKGNAINKKNNQAFGGADNEAEFLAKELNISKEEASSKTNDVDFNEKACVEDFLSRIDVKGRYKAKDYSKLHSDFETLKKEMKKKEEERDKEKEKEELLKNDEEEPKYIVDEALVPYKSARPHQELPNFKPQKEVITAYKQFKLKINPKTGEDMAPGYVFPLYVNTNEGGNKSGLKIGKWYKSGEGECFYDTENNRLYTKGKGYGVDKNKIDKLAYRPGWHLTNTPWGNQRGAGKVTGGPEGTGNNYRFTRDNEVWAKVEICVDNDVTDKAWNSEDHYLQSLGDSEYYKYKTNSNATDDQTWWIVDKIRIVDIMDDDDVDSTNEKFYNDLSNKTGRKINSDPLTYISKSNDIPYWKMPRQNGWRYHKQSTEN